MLEQRLPKLLLSHVNQRRQQEKGILEWLEYITEELQVIMTVQQTNVTCLAPWSA
jgi:hypothetical protein